MSRYGSLERKCALILEKVPFLKRWIKNFYVRLNYLIYKSHKHMIIDNATIVLPLDTAGREIFFGYYDRSPLNSRGDCVYCELVPGALPEKKSKIRILLNGKLLSETTAWNYQQGAMLTWLDEGHIIHNFFDNNRYRAKIVQISDGSSRLIDFPVYAVHETFALSLNFMRLAKYRPEYGYYNITTAKQKLSDDDDGIFLVDLVQNKVRLLISLKTLRELQQGRAMQGGGHKINHIQIAPDGQRCIFHYRWFDSAGCKYSRLYAMRVDGTELKLLADGGMVSHCNFINPTLVAGWMRIDGTDGYHMVDIVTGQVTPFCRDLQEDGHPSFTADGKLMLTDTYPDRSGLQHIMIYHMERREIVFKASFLSPIKYRGGKRCDLHPRWDPDGRGFTFDSVHTGQRGVYRIRLDGMDI